jgi:hypothetical protein
MLSKTEERINKKILKVADELRPFITRLDRFSVEQNKFYDLLRENTHKTQIIEERVQTLNDYQSEMTRLFKNDNMKLE